MAYGFGSSGGATRGGGGYGFAGATGGGGGFGGTPKKVTIGGSKSGLPGHFLSDVEDVFSGLPGIGVSVYHGLTAPTSIPGRLEGFASDLAKQELHNWKPFFVGYKDLVTGDISGYKANKGTFEKQFSEHPLPIVLDLALLTPAAAARGIALADVGKAAEAGTRLEKGAFTRALVKGQSPGPLRTIDVSLGSGETIPTRTVPRNAFRAWRAEYVDAMLKKLPGETPLVGEFKRAARATKRESRNTVYLKAISNPAIHDFQVAWSHLSKDERAALNLHNRIPIPDMLNSYKEILRVSGAPEAKQMLKILQDPKIVSLYKNLSPGILDTIEKGRALSEARTGLNVETGALTPLEASLSPYRHLRMLRGAKFITKSANAKRLRTVNAALNDIGRRKKGLVREATRLGQTDLSAAVKEGRLAANNMARQDKRFARLQEKMGPASNEVDAAMHEAHNLRDLVDHAMAGEDFDWNGVLHQGGAAPNVLGEMHDKLGEVFNRYERALAAEYGMEREVLKSSEAKQRVSTAKQGVGAARENRIKLLEAQRGKLTDLIDLQFQLHQLRDIIPTEEGHLVGGGTAESLAKEIERQGRPQPFFMPDVPATKEIRGFASPEGSIAAQRIRGDIYASKGLLFRTGMLALYPDVLSPSFLQAARHAFYTDLHETAKRLAIPVERNQGLPNGYEWLRTKRGQKIPTTEQARREHLREMSDVYGGKLEEDLTTVNAEQAEEIMQEGRRYRLAVPKAYAEEFRSQAHATRGIVAKLVQGSLDVWRALILHLRVPWLVNNIFGNTLLYAFRYAGAGGLRAFVNMIATTKGANAVRRLFTDKPSMRALSVDDVKEIFPSQVRGTFIGTQTPPIPRYHDLPEWVQTAANIPGSVLRFLPRIDRATEQGLRRSALNAMLDADPALKAMERRMKADVERWKKAGQIGPKPEPATFRGAAKRAVQESPDLRRLVEKDVNDSLGDFLSLSRKERDIIRQAVPFYAWMREITRIVLRMPLDHPGRTLLLAQLGKVGAEYTSQDVPSYLRGSIPIGQHGGITDALAFHSAIPYTTITDLSKSVQALLPNANADQQKAFLGNFNPFLTAAVRWFQKPGKTNAGLLGETVKQTVESLPQYRVLSNPPSALYPGRTSNDLLWQLLGSTKRSYDTQVAAQQALEGR